MGFAIVDRYRPILLDGRIGRYGRTIGNGAIKGIAVPALIVVTKFWPSLPTTD